MVNAAGLPAAVGGGLVNAVPVVNVPREDDSLLPANGFTSGACEAIGIPTAVEERPTVVDNVKLEAAPVAGLAPETLSEVGGCGGARADSFGGKVTETDMVFGGVRVRL